MRHGPLHPPTGDRQGASGPRTLHGLVGFTLAAALGVGALLFPTAAVAAVTVAALARLGRTLYRRLEADRQPPADASASETRPHAK
jgi:hypothetical protein